METFQTIIAYVCLGFASRVMAYAGPEEGLHAQEDGWIQAALNTVKSWEQAAQTNPVMLIFLIMLAPFVWIFAVVMTPVIFILICAVMTAFLCLLAIVSFLVCGFPVYVITMGYGFFFVLYVLSRLDVVGLKIQRIYTTALQLYYSITGFPSRMFHMVKREIRKLVREVRQWIGEDVLKYFNL